MTTSLQLQTKGWELHALTLIKKTTLSQAKLSFTNVLQAEFQNVEEGLLDKFLELHIHFLRPISTQQTKKGAQIQAGLS